MEILVYTVSLAFALMTPWTVEGKCCVPDQWEGSEGGSIGSNDPKTGGSLTQVSFSFSQRMG